MKKYIFIILILTFVLLGFYIYKLTTYTYITAKFKELRPMEENIPVYYKGIIIGRAKERKHTDSMNHTLIKIVLYPRHLLLPDNTQVFLKKEKKNKKERDFLELIYPQDPSNTMISDGSILEGIATVDIATFMANQHPDDLESLKGDLVQSVQNLSYAMESLGGLFDTATQTIKQNQHNIYQTTNNFKQTTSKINNATDERKLSNTLSSIELTTKNASNITQDVHSTTGNILQNVEEITDNVNAISCGTRKTLRKKAGGLRLFFGKVIDECN